MTNHDYNDDFFDDDLEAQNAMVSIPDDIRLTKAEFFYHIDQEGFAPLRNNPHLKKDYDTVLASVSLDAKNLEYADHTMQNNKNIVLEALNSHNGKYAFEFIHANLLQDEDVAKQAILIDGWALSKLDNKFKTEYTHTFAALKQIGAVSEKDKKKFTNSEDIILHYLIKHNNNRYLDFFSSNYPYLNELKNDPKRFFANQLVIKKEQGLLEQLTNSDLKVSSYKKVKL